MLDLYVTLMPLQIFLVTPFEYLDKRSPFSKLPAYQEPFVVAESVNYCACIYNTA